MPLNNCHVFNTCLLALFLFRLYFVTGLHQTCIPSLMNWVRAFMIFRMLLDFEVIKKPKVKQMLGLPDLPPPSTNQDATHQLQLIGLFPPPPPEQSRLSPSEQSLSPPPANESSKPVNRKLNSMPASAPSQRIKNLDKEVKGRKKGNKRSSG
ncbi:hypothetical protein SASPL_131063 [Salvia splendens]|uniref:Uncharacterized protein n=1 Tax=Salvia splendens TaxID=180675 RepID=A0A8X8XA91_SALSN|nr:hypothetical protein SASPL_131063 [Salvia splendens]